MLRYKTHVADRSMYNTPPTYGVYICGLVLSWIKSLGGVQEIAKINQKKADLLYSYLDSSRLFSPTVSKPDRSIMNICFVTGNQETDHKFIAQASSAGFVSLRGHRSVGGMRASIYNAMPIEGVEKLIQFMSDFEKNNI
ncbi:Phosphoserine aminotransferase [bioreactor metagenome]|uniref:phosphoserine transaminase n=1 Tax=bioreactor metagenome TaxID=1076179 RepID=A0A645FC53_9ZZZZ